MGLYYEELQLGLTIDHQITRTVTEMDNVLFSSLTMNPQPLHVDAHYAARTEFGRPIVNSLFTLGLMIGITVYDTTIGTTVANLGMNEVIFPAPVFHGDSIHVRTTVVRCRESRSRSDAGIVELRHEAFNQEDVLVASCLRIGLMLKRPG